MTTRARKYIFVVGGVISGVGKGVATSAIAALLQAKGLRVTAVKIDPYINIDAGTMNPTEHGEVFVLEDGDETDQDMGNYERFLGVNLSRINYMTTGRVYQEVIRRERNLEYRGKNVEVVPDIPLEVIRRIEASAKKADADVTLIEVGGTVGEYQNVLFLEAARMMRIKHPGDIAIVMVSYLPIPSKVGEMKTKPTQHAARALNSVGLQADVIIARAEQPLDQKRKEKISLLCSVPANRVISAPDIESIYDAPINYAKDKLGEALTELLYGQPLKHDRSRLAAWEDFAKRRKHAAKKVHIAIVGKYFSSGEFVMSDVYISVIEALKFSAIAADAQVQISYIGSPQFEEGKNLEQLAKYDGILVPGGFGKNGVEGKINVIRYAREHGIPFFGICYGMQLAVVEYARHMLGWQNAHTAEIAPETTHPVIDIMPDQKALMQDKNYGGTMRLGTYPATLRKGTLVHAAYGRTQIKERHRHRFEVNPRFVAKLSEGGLVFSGTSPDARLMETVELPQAVHPYFVACQFHPEFLARPFAPHPLFSAFIAAALDHRAARSESPDATASKLSWQVTK
ncbi:MAG TPA: CTP synthase [Candidatus Saccharimonadales bacterium]|nr:CTP synthase [Candidatus Saccharimonadales bacterium]